jgi:type II secretory pathway component PulF
MLNTIQLAFTRWFVCNLAQDARERIWKKLSKLLANGIPIITALRSLRDSRRKIYGQQDMLAHALSSWILQMENGYTLGAAVEGWVSPIESMLISTGESAGQLSQSLISAIDVMHAGSEIKKSVLSGLAYPSILLLIVCGLAYMFGFKIIPAFTRIVAEDKFTGLAALLIQFSALIRTYFFHAIIFIVTILILFKISLNMWLNSARTVFDKFPPYSIFKTIQASAWLIGLAALLEAGVRLENAMAQLSSGMGAWLQSRTQPVLQGVQSGMSLGDSLVSSGYDFPDLEIIDDIQTYSSVSGVEIAIGVIGRESLISAKEKIDVKMKIISGLALFVVALTIGFLIGGVINMQQQLGQLIQQR